NAIRLNKWTRTATGWVIMLLGGVTALATRLTWFSEFDAGFFPPVGNPLPSQPAGRVSYSGSWSGIGKVTLWLGIAVIVLGALVQFPRHRRRLWAAVAVVVGAVVLALGIYAVATLGRHVDEGPTAPAVGAGAWLAAVAGAATVAVAVIALF